MQLTFLALLLSITLAPTISQKLSPNAVKTLLQGILSPKNTEQVIQALTAAANKKRGLSNVCGTVNRRMVIADNVPRTVRNDVPNKFAQLIQRPQEMCLKKNVIVQNSNNVMKQNGKQIVLPKDMVVQRIETTLPKNVVIQNGGDIIVPRNVVVRKNEMPKRVVVQNNDFSLRVPQMRTPEVVQQLVKQQRGPIEQKVLMTQPLGEYVTVPKQKVCVFSNENQFLPAASPISPLIALKSSNAVPPAMPQSRGQFLRKMPIPPPTI